MRAVYFVTDWAGWLFCEIAFKTDMWGPFILSYRLGNWFYGLRPDDGCAA